MECGLLFQPVVSQMRLCGGFRCSLREVRWQSRFLPAGEPPDCLHSSKVRPVCVAFSLRKEISSVADPSSFAASLWSGEWQRFASGALSLAASSSLCLSSCRAWLAPGFVASCLSRVYFSVEARISGGPAGASRNHCWLAEVVAGQQLRDCGDQELFVGFESRV